MRFRDKISLLYVGAARCLDNLDVRDFVIVLFSSALERTRCLDNLDVPDFVIIFFPSMGGELDISTISMCEVS